MNFEPQPLFLFSCAFQVLGRHVVTRVEMKNLSNDLVDAAAGQLASNWLAPWTEQFYAEDLSRHP